MAGLVALLALAAIDGASAHWNPDPWVYALAPVMVWGTGMLPGLGRKG